MSTSTVADRAFSPGRGLMWLGGFVAFGTTLSGIYAISGLGVGCPFRLATGWECPFCGGTRLGASLLHGDLSAAFLYNPVVFVGLVLVAGLGLVWTVEAFGGPRFRPPAALRARLAVVSTTRWLVAGLIAAACYTVVRNLL